MAVATCWDFPEAGFVRYWAFVEHLNAVLQLRSKPEMPPKGVGRHATSPIAFLLQKHGTLLRLHSLLGPDVYVVQMRSIWPCEALCAGLQPQSTAKLHELPGMVAEGSPWR